MADENFVLFIDILGFSQLSANNPASEVVKICDSEFRQTALASIHRATLSSGIPTTLNFFSDTVSLEDRARIKQEQFRLQAAHADARYFVQTGLRGELQDVEQSLLNLHVMSDSLIAWTHNISVESLSLLCNFTAQLIGATVIFGLPLRGGISKGEIVVAEKPLNGSVSKNVYGSGFVSAHTFEGGQEWMGCVVDTECFAHFDKDVTPDAFMAQGAGIAVYEDIPYKSNCHFKSNVAIDWRDCLHKTTPNADYDFSRVCRILCKRTIGGKLPNCPEPQ